MTAIQISELETAIERHASAVHELRAAISNVAVTAGDLVKAHNAEIRKLGLLPPPLDSASLCGGLTIKLGRLGEMTLEIEPWQKPESAEASDPPSSR